MACDTFVYHHQSIKRGRKLIFTSLSRICFTIMKFLICLLSLFVVALARPDFSYEFQQPLPNNGKHWAVIVAGSNGYFNYRHQADACHAYHIMNKHGIPDEQIVMMMYDDIANNRENPVKGNIINRPNGQNLYPGVPKDYTGEEVNPTNFLNILLGKSSGGKKVINSTANDFVFINFIDHGAPGILGFGDRFLKVKDLMNTINQMHDEKRYAKMVFYIEACESGSMMENLPENINVYATTASNPHESSYACYFDKTRQTYLGDVYSIKWMQDSDKEDLNTETLHKQFLITQKETNTSHVMEYGDKTMGKMTVAEFQGTQQARSGSYRAGDPCGDSVKSEDVPLEILRRRLQLARTADEAADIASKLIMLQKEREMVNKTVQQIVERTVGTNFMDRVMNGPRSSIRDNNWDCYSNVVDIIQAKCKKTLNIPMNDYALRKLYMFVTMCDAGVPVQAMERAINEVCM